MRSYLCSAERMWARLPKMVGFWGGQVAGGFGLNEVCAERYALLMGGAQWPCLPSACGSASRDCTVAKTHSEVRVKCFQRASPHASVNCCALAGKMRDRAYQMACDSALRKRLVPAFLRTSPPALAFQGQPCHSAADKSADFADSVAPGVCLSRKQRTQHNGLHHDRPEHLPGHLRAGQGPQVRSCPASPPWPPWEAGIESGRARAPCLPLAGLRRRPAEQQAGCSVLRPGMWLPRAGPAAPPRATSLWLTARRRT